MASGAGGPAGGDRVSTTAIADRIRAARGAGTPVRIRGAGTWLDAGRPVGAKETLSVADDRGIVEYVPGDLTLTARAGTTLADLERATREHGQWLPLAPWGSAASTLGATISTATAGPYAAAFGLPRDAVLGIEFVTGAGDVVRAGGRVVKNVAGFDLTRLLIGSWGTLGVITEATVRLRSLAQVSRTIAIAIPDDSPAALDVLGATVRKLPFAPFVCELLNPAMANALALGRRTTLLVELGGNATAVAAQLDAFRPLGAATDAPDGIMEQLRTADAAMATWRVSSRPSRFAQSWSVAGQTPGALLHGNMTRGVVRVAAPSFDAVPSASGVRVVVERLPAAAWAAHPAHGDPLAASVRGKFDPDGILNPGILGEVA